MLKYYPNFLFLDKLYIFQVDETLHPRSFFTIDKWLNKKEDQKGKSMRFYSPHC